MNTMRALVFILSVLMGGCVGVPDGIKPVRGFDAKRYLGEWYEIARMDHAFERGLTHVSAQYSTREEGGIRVINRGFDTDSSSWEEAEGKAYFVGAEDTGHLKVSFFGPFYGSYIVFELGADYEYSLVTSSDKSYFWLLSRTAVIDPMLQQRLLDRLAALGFDTKGLIFVDQANKPQAPQQQG